MISLDALEALARKAGSWSAADLYEDTCAECRKEGRTEWGIGEIQGGYHAMFSDEDQARFIAACDPQTILELVKLARRGQ